MLNAARARALRWVLVGTLVFLGLGFTFAAMPVWMTPDSVEYLAMANSLAHGEGVRGFDGEPAGMWGPGFPTLLAPAIALGLDAFDALPWLHAWIWTLLLLGAVVPLAWQLQSWRWRWPLLVGTLVGAPVITVTSSMLADATLVAGVLGCTFLAERVRAGARPWGLVVLAALLPLVKIIGVMVWPAVVWALWHRDGSRWFGFAVTGLPLVAWSLRNFVWFGRFAERFPGQPLGFESVLRSSSAEFTSWFVPKLDSTDVLLVSGGLLTVVLILVWYRLGRPSLPGSGTPWLLTASSFVALFWLGSAIQKVSLPNSRLFAPLFVLALVLASRFGAALQHCGGIGIALLGFAWTAFIGIEGVAATRHHLLQPQAVYFDREDRFAAIVKSSVTDLDRSIRMWSNVPELVYWQTGRWCQWPEADRIDCCLGDPGSPVRVIWFSFSERDGLVHPREMAGVKWEQPIVRQQVELWRGVVRPVN